MENTIDNKRKFVAMYFGQIFSIGHSRGRINAIYETGVKCNSLSNGIDINGGWLELTTLSKITDEDAIEVYNLAISNKAHEMAYKLNESDFIEQGRNMAISCNIAFASRFTGVWYCLLVTDYLRSKGYALPFMGLSVDELVNRGWIKLKED